MFLKLNSSAYIINKTLNITMNHSEFLSIKGFGKNTQQLSKKNLLSLISGKRLDKGGEANQKNWN